MGQIDLGLDALFGARHARGFGGALSFSSSSLEMGTHLFRFVLLEGAGVSLFFRDPYQPQHIQNSLAFNFQFPGQIINSNLAHPPSLPPVRYAFIFNLTAWFDNFSACRSPFRSPRSLQLACRRVPAPAGPRLTRRNIAHEI